MSNTLANLTMPLSGGFTGMPKEVYSVLYNKTVLYNIDLNIKIQYCTLKFTAIIQRHCTMQF